MENDMSYEFTQDQIRELQRCSYDPIYFIEKYVMIRHPVDGTIPFDMFTYQKNMIKAFGQYPLTITLAPRQVGKSIVLCGYVLWYAMFRMDKTILITSNKNINAMELISRIRFMYDELPSWLRSGKGNCWNKHNLDFENGSRIISSAVTECAACGMSISLLVMDEFAFVRPSIQIDFWASIEHLLSCTTKCIITSTKSTETDLFAKIWKLATTLDPSNPFVGQNGFFPMQVKWDDVPGRDESFKRQLIATIGEKQWKQEYECEFET